MLDGSNFIKNEHYFFAYKLRNSEGDSLMSDSIEVMFADYPKAPKTPVKVDSKSSLDSIYVEWEIESEGDELNVLGYLLWMDSGSDGRF